MRGVEVRGAIGDRLGHQLGRSCRDARRDRFWNRSRDEPRAGAERGARGEQTRAGLSAGAGDYERMPVHSLVRVLGTRLDKMTEVVALEKAAARRYLLDRAGREA